MYAKWYAKQACLLTHIQIIILSQFGQNSFIFVYFYIPCACVCFDHHHHRSNVDLNLAKCQTDKKKFKAEAAQKQCVNLNACSFVGN